MSLPGFGTLSQKVGLKFILYRATVDYKFKNELDCIRLIIVKELAAVKQVL